MKLILASKSLGRQNLLKVFKIPFIAVESRVDEEQIQDKDPIQLALKRAQAKAQAVWLRQKNKKDLIVLGADTVGFLGNWIFGKPANRGQAAAMLKKLSGQTHSYVSAFVLISQKGRKEGYDVSSVTFKKMNQKEIGFYLDRVSFTKLCAGFTIDNSPQTFVTATKGSIANIIGLPMEKLKFLLWEMNPGQSF